MKQTEIQIHIQVKDAETELSSDITVNFDSVKAGKAWLETIEPLINNL